MMGEARSERRQGAKRRADDALLVMALDSLPHSLPSLLVRSYLSSEEGQFLAIISWSLAALSLTDATNSVNVVENIAGRSKEETGKSSSRTHFQALSSLSWGQNKLYFSNFKR